MKNSPIVKFGAKADPPKPPAELQKHGRLLWKRIQEEYQINDPGGLASLLTLCRSEDDIQRLRGQLARDGDIITDRFGQRAPHPLLAAVARAETTKRQAQYALKLDAQPPAKIGRPIGK